MDKTHTGKGFSLTQLAGHMDRYTYFQTSRQEGTALCAVYGNDERLKKKAP